MFERGVLIERRNGYYCPSRQVMLFSVQIVLAEHVAG